EPVPPASRTPFIPATPAASRSPWCVLRGRGAGRHFSHTDPPESLRTPGCRDEGAASLVDWIVQRCGVARATARNWATTSATLDDLPHLADGLAQGALSLDKVRAVMGRTTPENDAEMALEAQSRPVVELADLDRRAKGAPSSGDAQAA